MRNEEEIKKLILQVANSDNRIRAVLLNGSRANSKISADKYQDFDVVYIVNDMESFTSDHSWVDIFGDRIIQQLPDLMTSAAEGHQESIDFHYLMLFNDGNRIDLTLFPKNKLISDFKYDSLTISWLDKDYLFPNLPPPNDEDYYINKPAKKNFSDTCNEFWWVSTYVAKGLLRNEITYAKEMMETVVRPAFMQVVEWKIGFDNNFLVSFGKGGKMMTQYLSPIEYDKILSTYSDEQVENNWKSLIMMTDLFGEFAIQVADGLNFHYNATEEKNVKAYLKKLYYTQK